MTARAGVAVAALVVACWLGACGRDQRAANDAVTEEALLDQVPAPPLESLEVDVREGLVAARAEAAAALESAADDRMRALALGRLARVYHAHDLDSSARAAYRQALELDPGNTDLTYLAGRLALAHGRATEARKLLASAVADSVAAPSTSTNGPADVASRQAALAQAERLLWNTSAALDMAERAHQTAPGSVAALLALAEAAADAREFERAAFAFERLLVLQPRASKLRAPYGLVLSRLGSIREAEQQLAASGDGVLVEEDRLLAEVEALRMGSQARTLEATRLIEAGRWAEAIPVLERALEQDPRAADVHSNLAVALLRSGRAEESLEHLREAARLEPRALRPHLYLGSIQASLRRFEDAAASYHAALAIEPANLDARLGHASARLALGYVDEAAREFASVIEADSRRVGAWLGLAATQIRLGRGSDALSTLDRASAILPGDWRLETAWSRIVATSHDPSPAQAQRALERARSSPSDDPLAREALAMALAAVGDFAGAIETQERAIALIDALERGAHAASGPGARAANSSPLEARLQSNLERYRRGRRAADPALE